LHAHKDTDEPLAAISGFRQHREGIVSLHSSLVLFRSSSSHSRRITDWLKYFATNFTSATNSYYDFASVGAVIDNDVVFSNPAVSLPSSPRSSDIRLTNQRVCRRTLARKSDCSRPMFRTRIDRTLLHGWQTIRSSVGSLLLHLLEALYHTSRRLISSLCPSRSSYLVWKRCKCMFSSLFIASRAHAIPSF